ncbi:MAG: SUF system NifU family Fe-S cluster assembly protein [Proteobacteria bacterium]|nr:SUF system NifU family Fe-S cluster assembly protein [Pseudomonadota bacterium]
MSELRDLYQEVIRDHSRNPRNFGKLDSATHRAEGYNPLCGDELALELCVDEGREISQACFTGRGCAISTASASLLTEALCGKSVDEAEVLFETFHGAVTAPPDAPTDSESLGKLACLLGVREFPMRVKCASLAWHTLQAAVHGETDPITTE